MGLFSNNKKLCPICGAATPRLLATKVEDMPICSACADKMDIRQDVRDTLTVDRLNEYMTFYEANEPLKKEFKADFEHRTGGLLSPKGFFCDSVHKTFRLSSLNNTTVYSPGDFAKFVVYEDDVPVIELTPDKLLIHQSNAPAAILAMKDEIAEYNTKIGMKEMMVDAQKEIRHNEAVMKAREEGKFFNEYEYQKKEREAQFQNPGQNYTPSFNPQVPFKKWKVEVVLSHEWGAGLSDKDNMVWFKEDHPSVQEGLDNYYECLNRYKEIVMAFKQICCPNCAVVDESHVVGAGEQQNVQATASPQAVTGISSADEIKKYKDLLDAGVITQEEFDAKKKQLLGI